MKRYMVLGLARDIEAWRRERGLRHREVVAVSTLQGDRASRGLSGPFEVVRLPSWDRASERVQLEVERNIALAALSRRVDAGQPIG
jgi:hypothetical protein